jgi:broad specificity phosphatase PhoE
MPSFFLGKQIDDPKIAPIHQDIREHFYDPDWHHSDEENFTDLIARVKKTLELIESQKKENIVIITHGYFLTVLVFYLIFGENIDPHSFKSFREHTLFSNVGLTQVEFVDRKWKVRSVNDTNHLRIILGD